MGFGISSIPGNAQDQGRDRRARVEGMIRRLRLASGLVMFAYVTTHFVNHSLGLVSVQVMDHALEHIYQYWASLLGSVLLYGAFATHYSLALWALWQRRSLKMPFAEATQLVLGFSIPFFLTDHVRPTPRSSIRWWCGCVTPSWRRSLPCWPRGSRVGTGSGGAASSA